MGTNKYILTNNSFIILLYHKSKKNVCYIYINIELNTINNYFKLLLNVEMKQCSYKHS